MQKYELSEELLKDLRFKAENPPTKNDELLKAKFSTYSLEIFEEHICSVEYNTQ